MRSFFLHRSSNFLHRSILLDLSKRNAVLRRHGNQSISAGADCIGQQRAYDVRVQQKWSVSALPGMESAAQDSQFPARSQAYVRPPLLPQIVDRKDGSYQVFDVIPLRKRFSSFARKLALLILLWCGFLLFLINIYWIFIFLFVILCLLGAVLKKGILGYLSYRGKVVPSTASKPIPIDWVSWRVLLELRYLLSLCRFFFD